MAHVRLLILEELNPDARLTSQGRFVVLKSDTEREAANNLGLTTHEIIGRNPSENPPSRQMTVVGLEITNGEIVPFGTYVAAREVAARINNRAYPRKKKG